MKEWICTDGTQFVNKINETTFEVVEVVGTNEAGFRISQQVVDVNSFTECELLDVVNGYGYNSIKQIFEQYGDAANQVIAECMAETNWDLIDDLYFTSEDDALEYIEEKILEEKTNV